jgi:hypothetical protein
MILRALFAAIVIGLIIPHEPDIGMGRPGLRPQLVTILADLRQLYVQEGGSGLRHSGRKLTYCPTNQVAPKSTT